MKNLGFIYYKKYFKHLHFSMNVNGDFDFILDEIETGKLIKDLFDSDLSIYTPPSIDFANEHIELTTIYPGLLIGSGYNHEIGEQKNELKLGFYFDYTTGLPCIPGSSVKGVLRDAFEKDGGKYILSILEELATGERSSEIKNEITIFSSENAKHNVLLKQARQNYSEFVMRVFEGKKDKDNYLPLKQRDVFFDAFPIKSDNANQKFLANDYITHHANPFKNPNPIQFLKVLPQVVFQFNFQLSDELFPPKIKLELFRQILLDIGIGAKTNVGYGQFTADLSVNENRKSVNSNNAHKDDSVTLPKQSIPAGVKLNKNEEYESVLIRVDGAYSFFRFSKEGKECIVRKKTDNVYEKLKKNGYNSKLKTGEKVIIKIQGNFINSETPVSFQVLMQGNTI